MYEFVYEAFDFLNKFQDANAIKIFVIEDNIGFEFYYVEKGIIFSSSITKERILQHMNESYNMQIEEEEAIEKFKEMYLTNTTNPISVIKDNNNETSNDETENKTEESMKKTIKIDVIIAEKLKKFDFVFV